MTQHMLDIPKDLKRQNPWLIILAIGLIGTGFVLAASSLRAAALATVPVLAG